MLVLVKHAQPVLEPDVAPRYWRLGPEGEAQSRALAALLAQFLPLALFASPEPKADATATIVGEALSVPVRTVDGLEEFDRPALPILSKAEHERLNAAIFADLSTPVLGRESGHAALARFAAAIEGALEQTPEGHNTVVISHGTVIALYVAAQRGNDARLRTNKANGGALGFSDDRRMTTS